MPKLHRKIGVFSSSSPLTREPLSTDYQFLRSKGFQVFEHPQVRDRVGHLAGTVEERVEAIHSMLQDNSIDLLMAYWGGANSNQILPYLDYELIRKYPKPIVGFSDTSAILLAINKLSGIRTYMGPSGITFDKPDPFEYSYEYLRRIVLEPEQEVEIIDSEHFADDLYFLREDSDRRLIQKNAGRKVYRHGSAEGVVLASNLQTLLVLAGTKYFPDLEGKMLFLEEAETADPAMVHRYLTHLSQVSDLNSLSGILIGRFASQSQFKDGDTEEMIYDDVFRGVDIPIVHNLDFGHTDPLFTIPIGGKARLNTENNELMFQID